ncbi:hypothetical protein JCM1841_001312 [Sporobolomyces salmonicolor]
MLLLTLTSALMLASFAAAQNITSPASVTECLPQQIEVSGGTPPYTVTVLPGAQIGATPLETLPTVEDPGSVTWLVDLPAGQNITFAVRDSTGALSYSSEIPQAMFPLSPVGHRLQGRKPDHCFWCNGITNPLSVGLHSMFPGDPAATSTVRVSSAASPTSTTGAAASATATRNGLGRTAKAGLEISSDMLLLLLALASSALLATLGAAQNNTAQNDTISMTAPATIEECYPAALNVSGGTAPYTIFGESLSLLPGGKTSGTPLEILPTVNASGPVGWFVDLASGQNVTFAAQVS